jgi:hypothetical protein
MASGGKKRTTMAKLARENRLRERRVIKQAKKDARKLASADDLHSQTQSLEAPTAEAGQPEEQALAPDASDEAVRAFQEVNPKPVDPRAKEAALRRLHDASDEQLAVFEDKLRDDALQAGATEQEMRGAQRNHPEHGG